MKRHLYFILYFCLSFLLVSQAKASSLDELYREIIRSDNDGYLPLFVKNRSVPDILIEEEYIKKSLSSSDNKLRGEVPAPVNLSNNRKEKDSVEKKLQLRWQKTLEAVRENRVTPLEFEEISTRVNRGDPQATEILAWIHAKGVGTKIDLLKAFNLYNRAAELHVPQAQENAAKVYQAMNPAQKRELQTALAQLPTISAIPESDSN